MAYTFSLNNITTDKGKAIWILKETLKSAGWTIKGSSDGTSFGMDGVDRLDPGSTYNGAFNVNNVWFVIVEPPDGIGREFMIQRYTNAADWYVYYSSNGIGFSGGGATTAPTAADEQIIVTQASANFFADVDNRVIVDCMAGDISEKFSFHFSCRNLASDDIKTSLYMDVLTMTSSLDQDPAIVGRKYGSSSETGYNFNCALFNATAATIQSNGGVGWYRKNLSNSAFVKYPIITYRNEIGTGFGAIQDYFSHFYNQPNKMSEMLCVYSRGDHLTESGIKGFSTLFKMVPSTYGGGYTYNNKTRAVFYGLSIPWDGNTEIFR